MPSPIRPGRIRQPPGNRGANSFNVFFLLLTAVTAAVVFAGAMTFIHFWQKTVAWEAWTQEHPRLEAAKSSGQGKPKPPWLGAEAGELDIFWSIGRRAVDIQKSAPRWWADSSTKLQKYCFTAVVDSSWDIGGPATSQHGMVAATSQQHDLGGDGDAYVKGGFSTPGMSFPVTRDDLVVVLPTHKATEAQVSAGRSARLGIQTVVVTNYIEGKGRSYPKAGNEIWLYYPDADPVRSFYAGDPRAALAPFIAFEAIGDHFKWLFYGDDDTVLFADAALKLASSLDPDLPYFVTDNLWWSEQFGGAYHPHPQAPRCLPCGYKKNVTGALGMLMAVGCPCTPLLICSLPGGNNGTFANRGCGAPRTPVRSYSMHGGAGALISVGLLRRINWSTMEKCVNHQWNSGGDAFITTCLWEQGFAHTTPDPLWHPRGLQMFDPSPEGLNPDDFITWKVSHVLGNLLQHNAGVCEGLCKLEFESTMTTHLRARRTGGSDEGAAMFVRALSRLYSTAIGRLEAHQLADTTSHWAASLADKIDAQLKAATDVVRKILSLHEEAASQAKGVEQLELGTELGRVGMRDSVRSGIADAVASRLLALVMEVVEPFSKEGM